MNVFTSLANLAASLVKPAKPAYTTVIYPRKGLAVLLHDGLGIHQERPWYQFISSGMERTLDAASNLPVIHPVWADLDELLQTEEISPVYSGSNVEAIKPVLINPATGCAMLESGIDVMGNPYGMDMTSDAWSGDHDTSDLEGNYSFEFD